MDNKNTPIINIENIHIHLDERIFSKNFNDRPACCDECCGCDDEPEISTEELIKKIREDTHLPYAIISTVLEAENKALEAWFAEEKEEDYEDPDELDEEDEPISSSDKNDIVHTLVGLLMVNLFRQIMEKKKEDKPHEE